MPNLELSIQVEGVSQAADQLGRVDQALDGVSQTARKADGAIACAADAVNTGAFKRLADIFSDTGIAVNRTSREVATLTSRMEAVARNNAFGRLAQEANLSQTQIARLRMEMGDYAGAAASAAQALKSHKLAIAGAVASMGLFAKSCLEAQEEMQKLDLAYESVFGSQGQARLKAVYVQADRLGLKFRESAEAAKGFFAAGKGTALEGDLQKIFNAVTNAGAALQLSTDEVNGSLLALGQMISKGKVQAEELRGQLGERLPGAFRIAAEAMGMTTAELDKFMADGKLTAEDLLPKLADALENRFGEAAVNAANTLSGALNRMENEWTRFKAKIMDSGPIVSGIKFATDGLKQINDAMEETRAREKQQALLERHNVAPTEITPTLRVFGKDILEPGKQYGKDLLGLAGSALGVGGMLDQVKRVRDDFAQKEDKILQQARSRYEDSIKDTAESKARALVQDKVDALAAIQKQLDQAKKSGNQEIIREWENNYSKAEKAWDDQIRNLTDKAAKSGNAAGAAAGKAAKSAAVAQADYTGELERTQNAIASLEQQLGLSKAECFTEAKIRAEQKYQDAISKTSEELAKQVARGSLSQAQADTLRVEKEKQASLQKQLAIKQAEQKQDQKNVQIAQGQIRFYKELGQLSGNYANTVDLQNSLLQKQAQEYREVYGISEELIQQWLYLQQLQNSTDPFDGEYRGLLKFEAEYADSAKQWENITYNFGKDFMSTTRDMFDDFLETGKTSFDGFRDLFKKFLKDLAWQAIAQPVMLSIVGGITGAMAGGGVAQAGTAGGAVMAGGAAGGNMTGQLTSGVSSLVQSQVTNQLMGSGGIMGSITSGINSAVAEMFPSLFVSSEQAVINSALNEAQSLAYGTAGNLSTTTFTSALGTAGIGAGIGAMASPFVNNLLGLQNNTGSEVGSMLGGGLGTLGGALIAASAIPGAGWIAGGVAALGSLLGGGIGSLFSGGEVEKPELYINAGANLWENAGKLAQTPAGPAALFNTGDDYFTSSFARAEAAQGTSYSVGQGVAEYLSGIIEYGQETSRAIADTLGEFDQSLRQAYLEQLRESGRIDSALYLEGENITSERVEQFGQAMADLMQGAMLDSLSKLDLEPLVTAADGKFADTASELGKAIGDLVSYVNLSASIADEEMKASFVENVIPQMTQALDNLSLAPLAKTSRGFAIRTLDQLSAALNDVFSVYDAGEAIQDESIKKAFQQWAQEAITGAFANVNLSFLRVDFDKESFTGLQ